MSELKIVNSKITHPEMFTNLVWGDGMETYAGSDNTIVTYGDKFELADLSFEGGYPAYKTVVAQMREKLDDGSYTEFEDILTLSNTMSRFVYSPLHYKHYYFRLKVISQDGIEIYTNVLEIDKKVSVHYSRPSEHYSDYRS